ncbi:MAG: hypothetical protein HC836_27100 [Richelia sp. RM2_1_2]|nr:hypothetical protein [Richelia sp. SM2_1_7]NJM22967.1 hypothetical protein [Richelia sp. SM1_7_0]NJN08044.1 hypothetical protein [Richelia sp. RM1_1_1]NJO29319.1 hypothetical protein [Richelia sp. SL_2_1]NJO61773.1 hypothetical protein [Richelia sp. RM2_1_2]
MSSISLIIFLFFFPACLGILRQVILSTELSHQLLALAIFLLCIEQANMANHDLQKVADAKQQVKDARLNYFQIITIVTIIIELIGFYLSSIWLGWGSIVILFGLIWFNLFVDIKINSSSENSSENIIQIWKISERLPVLIADIVGLLLISMWILKIGDFGISLGLFAMTILYCSIKLFLFFTLLSTRLLIQ